MWRKRILAGVYLGMLSIGCLLYPIPLAAAPGDILWQINMPGSQIPTIAEDGTIYAYANAEERLYALRPNGSIKWATVIFVISPPVAAFDGAVYVPMSYPLPEGFFFGVQPRSLLVLNPDGTARWRFTHQLTENGYGPAKIPAIGSGGTIYMAFNEIYHGVIEAVRWDGKPLWSVATSMEIKDIVVGQEGNFFISVAPFLPEAPYKIQSFRADGTLRWVREDAARTVSPLAVGGDGTLYAGFDTNLTAISDGGATRWVFPASEPLSQAAAVNADGAVFLTIGKKVYSLDDRGAKTWEFEADTPIATPLTLASDGGILFGSVSNRLYALFPGGTLNWTVDLEPGGGISAPILGNDGTIVIRAGDRLYAIDNGGVGPAQHGWPMVRRDPSQTGSQFSAAIVPDAPKEFTATTNLYGINLTWTNVSGASSYEIWRGPGTNVGDAALVADIGARTDYFDREAGSGRTNYYWIRASSGSVPGAFTEPVLGYSRELQPGDLLKTITVGPCLGEMAISKDGSIFVGAGLQAPEYTEHGVYGLNPDGTVRWVYGKMLFPDQISVSDSGHVFAGYVEDIVAKGVLFSPEVEMTSLSASKGSIDFATPSGSLLLDDGSRAYYSITAIAISSDDRIYASISSGGLLAFLPPSFEPIWNLGASSGKVAPAIGPDGTIFQGGSSGVTAVNSDGTTRWTYASTNETFESWLAIDGEGRVYARSGTNDSRTTLHCIGPDGRHLWQYSDGYSLSSPVIDADGAAYFSGGSLIALDRNGGLKWQVVKTNHLYGGAWSAPAVGSDGTVYATISGYLYAYDSATGTEKWNTPAGLNTSSPLFLEEGAVAFCSDSGIYFVKAATGSRWSPWPMAGHDLQRTFRAFQRGLRVQKESDVVRLEMTMEKGKRYRLEASTDLKDWTVMSDFVSTNAVAQFKDTSQERRFYRSVVFP